MGVVIIVPDVDFREKNLGSVTIKESEPLQSLGISGPNEVFGEMAEYAPIYVPAGTSQRNVAWSIESGKQYASINQLTGVLTVVSGAESNDVVIKVTSLDNSEIFATKSIKVTSQSTTIERTRKVGSGVAGSRYKLQVADFDTDPKLQFLNLSSGVASPWFYNEYNISEFVGQKLKIKSSTSGNNPYNVREIVFTNVILSGLGEGSQSATPSYSQYVVGSKLVSSGTKIGVSGEADTYVNEIIVPNGAVGLYVNGLVTGQLTTDSIEVSVV